MRKLSQSDRYYLLAHLKIFNFKHTVVTDYSFSQAVHNSELFVKDMTNNNFYYFIKQKTAKSLLIGTMYEQ